MNTNLILIIGVILLISVIIVILFEEMNRRIENNGDKLASCQNELISCIASGKSMDDCNKTYQQCIS